MTSASSNHSIVNDCSSKIFKFNSLLELSIDTNKISRGRGLFLKNNLGKTIKPGTTLMSLAPHVSTLDTLSLSSRCSSCFLEKEDFRADNSSDFNRSIRRCGKCKVVAYCGSNCQQLDWADHKPECVALINYRKLAEEVIEANQKSKSKSQSDHSKGGTRDSFGLVDVEADGDTQVISRVPSAAVRALGRLIWKKSRKEKIDPDWWTGLSELQNHLNDYNSIQEEWLMQLSVSLSRYVGTQDLLAVFESASALLPFCSRFIDNSFTLTSITQDQIGVVFIPSASFINHSCAPNTVVVFPEGGEGASNKAGKDWAKVIAIKPVQPGEEIVTSYIDTAGTTQERLNELTKRYKFVCDCILCQSRWIDQVDPREALKCPKCTNWFSIGRTICNLSQVKEGTSRLDAGPSSKKSARKEITCPHCDFSRLIDVEGQRSAIKRSGKALDPVKEPVKAGFYAEKAIEWLQSKLSPFTSGPGFYPILDLKRMRMTSYLMQPHKNYLKQVTADAQQIITGVHQIYGVGHPTAIVARSTIAKLYGYVCSSSMRTWESQSSPTNEEVNQLKLELQLLDSLKTYQRSALEECLIGFGSSNGGGWLGRSISSSIDLTEREIIGRRRLLESYS